MEKALSEMKSRAYMENKERYETGQAMRKVGKTPTQEENEAKMPMSFNELVEKHSQDLSDDYSKRSKTAKQKKSSGFASPYASGEVIGAGSGE